MSWFIGGEVGFSLEQVMSEMPGACRGGVQWAASTQM